MARAKPARELDSPRGRRLLPALALAASLLASAALAAEFKSERGFALTYPDGWRTLSKEQSKEVADQARAALPKGAEVDLDKLAVVLFHAAPTALGETVNVVVMPGRLPITSDSCAAHRQQLLDDYARLGAKVSEVDSRLAKVGGRDAISWHCVVQSPNLDPPMRQWQVVLSNRKHTYFVTCTAPASTYDKTEPVFTQIVNSLWIEPDKGFALDDLSPMARSAVIGAGIGAVVGAVIAAVRIARRKPRPPA